MKRFKAIMLSTTIIFSSVASAQKSDLTFIKKNLNSWQPIEISLKDNQITVVTPDTKIDDDIYTAIISRGICSPIGAKDAPAGYLNDIKQINVTNKFKEFGYSLVDPLIICHEMGRLMKKKAMAVLLGNTHLYSKGP